MVRADGVDTADRADRTDRTEVTMSLMRIGPQSSWRRGTFSRRAGIRTTDRMVRRQLRHYTMLRDESRKIISSHTQHWLRML